MKEPEVTVLMSVYNGEKHLREAVESILNKTFSDFEFLIINDGSTDRTLDILESYNDTRIIVINQKNIGLAKSLNKGIAMAKGEYIARLDSDDISMPHRLEKQLEFMNNHKEIHLLGASAEIIDEKGIHIDDCIFNVTSELLFYRLIYGNYFIHSSAFFNKEYILGIGGYTEKILYVEDFDLWSRVSRSKNIIILPEKLVKLRKRPTSISQMNDAVQIESAKHIIKINIETIIKEEICHNDILILMADYLCAKESSKDLEIGDFKRALSIFDKINSEVIGASVDMHFNEAKIRAAMKTKLLEIMRKEKSFSPWKFYLFPRVRYLISFLNCGFQRRSH